MNLAYLTIANPPRPFFGRSLVHDLVGHASQLVAIPRDEIIGASRTRDLAYTRFAIMLVARENGRSLPQIARELGNRDHTTVIAGLRRAKVLMGECRDFKRLVQMLRARAAQ